MAIPTQTQAHIRKPEPAPDRADHETVPRFVEVARDIPAPPERVMRVLADGWLYASWVVGASHIREVDDGWPRVGASVHHAVGGWPFLIKDHTDCLEYDPTGLLVLRARAWPVGEALVRIEVRPTAEGCRVVMGERSLHGPALALRPVEPVLIPPRNRESLARLAALAVGRAA